MKKLHRADLYGWSVFDESRNIDFHSVLWQRAEGNVVVDPLPLTPHDEAHLRELGGAALSVVTNSDHVRDTKRLVELTGARVAGPKAERETFPIACDLWLGEGDEPVPGLKIIELHGSKTPGELALLLEKETLITGDLVRAHRAGALDMLPASKLKDRAAAIDSIRRLLDYPDVKVVLTGDGWPVFGAGNRALRELVALIED